MHKLDNIKQEAAQIRLTEAEKSAMRANIFGHQSIPAARPSPYVFYSLFAHHMRMVVAGVLIFVLAGAGSVSAAAQKALPGDILYPVKVSVNERVEVALAPDSAAQALVEVKLADRRVGEAQTLAAQGRLDEKTADTLGEYFDTHAAGALALVEPDEEEEQAVADVSLEVEAAIVPAPERSAKSAPTARTMMVGTFAAPEAGETALATSGAEERPQIKKPSKHRELRESLRAKREIIKELKERSIKKENRVEY